MEKPDDDAERFLDDHLTVRRLFEWSKALAALVAALGVLASGYVMAGLPYPATNKHIETALEPIVENQSQTRRAIAELREFAKQTRGLILRSDRRNILREIELYKQDVAAAKKPPSREVRRLLERLAEDVARIDEQIEVLEGGG